MKAKQGWMGLLVIGLLLIPVFSNGAVVGVTDTEVWVGITTPLSGPAALWGATGQGAKAWADYVNDKGGVHGRKIKVILKDDGYNPARAMANLTEMKGKVFSVVALLGTAVVNACKDFFYDNKIPLVDAYGDVRIWAKYPKEKLKYVFVAYPDYEDEAEYLADYAIKKMGGKKLAVFYQNDDYGKMGLQGVKTTVSKSQGKAQVAAAVPYEVTERALGTHALKMKESGADVVFLYTTMSHAALILKEMAKVDYRPKTMVSFPMADPIMYTTAGELWEGVYPAGAGQVGVLGEPDMDRVSEILKKYEPSLKGKEYLAVFGAVSMMTFVEGLKNAGKNLTQESLIVGLEKIKNWKPEGIGAGITFSPTRHHGLNASRLLHAEKGKHVPLSDYVIHKAYF
ncbi:MAG: ABC transporter substrate-binding protein [Thermodesulfobacteriota bacterium]